MTSFLRLCVCFCACQNALLRSLIIAIALKTAEGKAKVLSWDSMHCVLVPNGELSSLQLALSCLLDIALSTLVQLLHLLPKVASLIAFVKSNCSAPAQ